MTVDIEYNWQDQRVEVEGSENKGKRFVFSILSAFLVGIVLGSYGIDGFFTVMLATFISYNFVWYAQTAYTQFKVRKFEEKLNRVDKPPHAVLDEFVLWKKGDYIKSDLTNAKFLGVLDNNKIVLQGEMYYEEEQGPYLLSPHFFEEVGYENELMEDRKRDKYKESVHAALKESNYMNFLDEFKNAYDEQQTSKAWIKA